MRWLSATTRLQTSLGRAMRSSWPASALCRSGQRSTVENGLLSRAPPADALMIPLSVLPLAILVVLIVHVALPLLRAPLDRTLPLPIVTAQVTEPESRGNVVCSVLDHTLMAATTVTPAVGFAGLNVTPPRGACPTLTCIEVVSLAEFGSGADVLEIAAVNVWAPGDCATTVPTPKAAARLVPWPGVTLAVQVACSTLLVQPCPAGPAHEMPAGKVTVIVTSPAALCAPFQPTCAEMVNRWLAVGPPLRELTKATFASVTAKSSDAARAATVPGVNIATSAIPATRTIGQRASRRSMPCDRAPR